jgi:hypothetical protein
MNNACRKMTFVEVVDKGFTVHCCQNFIDLVYCILFYNALFMYMPYYLQFF